MFDIISKFTENFFFYLSSELSAHFPEGITAGGVHLPTLSFNEQK